MDNFFIILLLLTPIFFLVGMVKPKIYSRIFKRQLSRLKILLITFGIGFASIVGFAVTMDTEAEPEVRNETAEEQVVQDQTETEDGNVEGAQEASEEDQQGEGERAETILVTRVIDGDTIEIEGGEKVRYIGINTPEVGNCYASEATARNRELVLNKQVRLEKDVSEEDRYGRLLRHIWVGDTMVNESLVRQGYAQVATYPPDVKYQERFSSAEQEARSGSLGLWGTVCEQDTSSGSQVTPAPTQSSSCDCSSGDIYNCSDFSTHSEAQACFESCGGVSNDVHGLDGNNDGDACEGLR